MSLQLLEIEKELAGPNADQALAKYDEILIGLENRIAQELDNGLPPEEFKKIQTLREVNILARKLLRITVKNGQA